MKIIPKHLKLIAPLLSLLFLFFCCENPDKKTPCFFVEIASECHKESTIVHYDVSPHEYDKITSYLRSYDPNYYSGEECISITFKTKEGVNVNGYFVSHFACD